MSVLSCNNISLSYGTDVVLKDISFSVNAGTKLGIIGANGAGKSTLLKIISGEIDADSGSVSIAAGTRLARLEQYTDSYFDGVKALDILFSKFKYFTDMEDELSELEKVLTRGDEKAIMRYASLHEEYDRLGGYEYKAKAMVTMKKLGFSDDDLRKNANMLSGGQKTKLALASLLMSSSDIILLDEPTNHLDIESTLWLEEQIRSSTSTFIVVSHDRYFLDRVTTDTLEIENTRCSMYSGGYSVFKAKKKKLVEDALKHFQVQQKEIARLEAFIENQKKWNRERNIIAAESRRKAIDRMVKFEKPTDAPASISMKITTDVKSSYDVLSVRSVSKSFGAKALFSNLSFELKKADRLFIIGGNGTGKSTLLKIINGVISQDSGTVEFGYNQKSGYYDQEQMLLDDSCNVISEIWNVYPDFTQTELRSVLAQYGFRGDDVFKNVCDLSGGEKARLAIAKLVLSGSSLLILDEPTNYLDIPSKEVLEGALSEYNGTLICVSHDRYIVSALATRILDIDHRYQDGYRLYEGTYSDYLRLKPTFNSAEEKPQKVLTDAAKEYQSKKREQSDKRKLEKKKERLENRINEIETRLSELTTLATEYSTDYIKLAEFEEERTSLDEELLGCYDELIELI